MVFFLSLFKYAERGHCIYFYSNLDPLIIHLFIGLPEPGSERISPALAPRQRLHVKKAVNDLALISSK